MTTGLTDNEIIQRVLRGDQALYAHLVDRYRNMVFTIALRYIPHREDAEELAQDIFVKAFRSLSSFRGDARFSTWLYTIATTSCLSFLRKKQPAIRSLDQEGMAALADTGVYTNPTEQKSRAAMINRAINLLSADDSLLITLFYKSEQTLDEIATILRLETNTVKVRLFRARQRLKEKMETHFAQEIKDWAE